MQKRLIYVIAITLVIALAGIDSTAFSKTQRKKSSKAKVSKSARSKAKSSRVAKSSRGKRSRAVAKSKRSRRSRYRAQPVTNSQLTARRAGIPTERVSEIQTALIKSGFLDGTPTGEYDQNTVQAMKAFQARNGLRQTGMPSATTLKKLSVAKTSNDGYSVPVRKNINNEKPSEKIQDQ